MKKTEIRCYLNLATSNAFLEKNKKRLGDLFLNRKIMCEFVKTRVDAGIVLFDTGFVESLSLETLLVKFIDEIVMAFPDFNELFLDTDFDVKRIETVINIYDDHMPSIYLDVAIIKYMSLMGLEIEFDLYSYKN